MIKHHTLKLVTLKLVTRRKSPRRYISTRDEEKSRPEAAFSVAIDIAARFPRIYFYAIKHAIKPQIFGICI
jgi:hypothetical protein